MILWPLTKGKQNVLWNKGCFPWKGVALSLSPMAAAQLLSQRGAGLRGLAYLSWLSKRAVRVETTVPTQPQRAHQGFWTRSPTRIRIPLMGLLTNTTWDMPRSIQSMNWSTTGLSGERRGAELWTKQNNIKVHPEQSHQNRLEVKLWDIL